MERAEGTRSERAEEGGGKRRAERGQERPAGWEEMCTIHLLGA